MSTHEQQTSTIPTSVVRNTGGKSGPQNLEEPASNEALRELCDKNYHQLLPLIAEKMQKEKEQQDKLKASPEEGMGASTPEARHQSPASSEDSSKTDLLHLGPGHRRRDVCSIDWEEKNNARIHALIVTTRVPKQREPRYRQESIIMRAHRPDRNTSGYSKKQKRANGCWGHGNPNQKGIGLMTCHMFNSTLTGNARVWFDKLPKESIDSYEDLRAAFRENYRQQTKHIKDPVEIHHIKQRDGESTEDFMERYKEEVLDVGTRFQGSAGMHEDLRIHAWDNPP
ncbi:reverse transcriptase domain-containing protein [Tanacetum coccineum]